MKDSETVVVATLTGPGCPPLMLPLRSFVLKENGVFKFSAFWDDETSFLQAVNRQYDHLSLTWYENDKPTASKVNEIVYTSSAPFNIGGELVMEDGLSFATAHIYLEPRQGVYA